MQNAIPTPLQLLREARAIITKPEAWTQGTAARDAAGEPIGVEHQDAVSWCATGALNCAMYRHTDSLQVPLPLQRAWERAGDILTRTVRDLTLGHYTQATKYNDATNHGCILHTYDIAISDAERLARQSSA